MLLQQPRWNVAYFSTLLYGHTLSLTVMPLPAVQCDWLELYIILCYWLCKFSCQMWRCHKVRCERVFSYWCLAFVGVQTAWVVQHWEAGKPATAEAAGWSEAGDDRTDQGPWETTEGRRTAGGRNHWAERDGTLPSFVRSFSSGAAVDC